MNSIQFFFRGICVLAGLAPFASLSAQEPTPPVEIDFPETPLIVSTPEKPNLMVLFDTSSSMRNIVEESNGDGRDDKYNAEKDYAPGGCRSPGHQVPVVGNNPWESIVMMNLDTDTSGLSDNRARPRIRVADGGGIYEWGESGGKKCFIPDREYRAQLQSVSDYPLNSSDNSKYSGNFLNWYFCQLNDSEENRVCSNNSTNSGTMVRTIETNYTDPVAESGRVDYSIWVREGARDRIQLSRKSMFDFFNSVNGVNVGVSSYAFADRDCILVSPAIYSPYPSDAAPHQYAGIDGVCTRYKERVRGGYPRIINSVGRILQPIKDIDGSEHRAKLLHTIDTLSVDGATPLDGATGDIGRYFVEGFQDNGIDTDNYVTTGTGNVATDTMFSHEPQYEQSAFKPSSDSRVIKSYCQSNYLITLTDGDPSGGTTISPSLRNYAEQVNARVYVNAGVGSTTGGWKNALRGLYEMDLRPDLGRAGSNENVKQSIVSFIIGFGRAVNNTQTTELFETAAEFAGPNSSSTPPVPYPTADNPSRYYSALDESGLTDALNSIVESIYRGSGSLASLAFETTSLDVNSAVFQSRFHSSDWTGSLIANAITNPNPFAIEPRWEARGKLDDLVVDSSDGGSAPQDTSGRVIFTYNGQEGIPFQWEYVDNEAGTPPAGAFIGADLAQSSAVLISDEEDEALEDGSLSEPRNFSGKQALQFIRGDRSKQGAAGNSFRTRELVQDSYDNVTGEGGLLGDIVNSSPVFVGDPVNFSYSNNPGVNRTPIVYVGANDGMLHGFNATLGATNSGKEVLAYIPSMLASSDAGKGLHYLTEQGYGHRDYVDLTPTVAEAETPTPGDWKTVLVGGLRAGGKGYYALNITDPNDFITESSANARTVVMWEFSEGDDVDMGYSFAHPVITKLANGKWAAIVGNGYNSTNGKAALYIIYLNGPGNDNEWDADSEFIKIEVPGGANNGLSSVAVADHLTSTGTAGSDGIADRVYGGDLNGNMWVFDLRGINTVNDGAADVTHYRLFTAKDENGNPQPITTAALLARNTANDDSRINENEDGEDLLIMFGTGQYISESDVTSRAKQAYYAVSDNGEVNLTRTDLAERIPTIVDGWRTFDTDVDNDDEIDEGVAIDWSSARGDGGQYGWRIELPDGQTGDYSAERVVSRPFKQNNILFFTTIVPNFSECNNSGGRGWIMGVDFRTGLPPADFSVFVDSRGVDGINELEVGGIATESMVSNVMVSRGQGLAGGHDGASYNPPVDTGGSVNAGRQGWEEIIFQ